jgi:hypothetical protein
MTNFVLSPDKQLLAIWFIGLVCGATVAYFAVVELGRFQFLLCEYAGTPNQGFIAGADESLVFLPFG